MFLKISAIKRLNVSERQKSTHIKKIAYFLGSVLRLLECTGLCLICTGLSITLCTSRPGSGCGIRCRSPRPSSSCCTSAIPRCRVSSIACRSLCIGSCVLVSCCLISGCCVLRGCRLGIVRVSVVLIFSVLNIRQVLFFKAVMG